MIYEHNNATDTQTGFVQKYLPFVGRVVGQGGQHAMGFSALISISVLQAVIIQNTILQNFTEGCITKISHTYKHEISYVLQYTDRAAD